MLTVIIQKLLNRSHLANSLSQLDKMQYRWHCNGGSRAISLCWNLQRQVWSLLRLFCCKHWNLKHAEIMGVILAIECASQRNWTNIWIESDSVLATLAFKSPSIIPWQLKNRWLKCIILNNHT